MNRVALASQAVGRSSSLGVPKILIETPAASPRHLAA
jgi:hypothetical protein